jgi:hypothetical protein
VILNLNDGIDGELTISDGREFHMNGTRTKKKRVSETINFRLNTMS